jgi:PDZ domain/Aspartyl protease
VALSRVARPVVLLACLAGCFHGPVVPPPAVAVVPFDPYGGAIYVPAIVNGDSAWLMFDTGLSHSGLDRDWARSVGVTAATDTSITAVVGALRLGDLTLDSYRAALYSLGGLSEASGRQQLGLLGHDVLHRFVVEIDYPTRRVRLFDATSYRYRGPGAAVPFTPDADLPLLRAKIKVRGRRAIPARLLLDTGASGLCLILTAPFVEQHGLASVVPAIAAPIGTGLVGELHGTIVRLQQLELGRLRVASPTTGLGGENKGFLGRTDIDGVIGNAVFEGSRLIVDYARRRVIIEPRIAASSLCDYDMSGLRLVARGPGLRRVMVDYVVPKSPSADVGVQAGDELLRIDGRGVAEADLSDVRKLLRVEGAMHHLMLRRDADTIRVDLRLRRLL